MYVIQFLHPDERGDYEVVYRAKGYGFSEDVRKARIYQSLEAAMVELGSLHENGGFRTEDLIHVISNKKPFDDVILGFEVYKTKWILYRVG